MKVGDTVRILRTDIKGLKSDKGIVSIIDGEYISVRPLFLKHEIELYRNELEVIE